VLDDAGEAKRRSVGSGGNESAQDGLGEVRVGSAAQEAEELKNVR